MRQKVLWIAVMLLLFGAAGCTAPFEEPPPVSGSVPSSFQGGSTQEDGDAVPDEAEDVRSSQSPVSGGLPMPGGDGPDHELLSLLVNRTSSLAVTAGDGQTYGTMSYEQPVFVLSEDALPPDRAGVPVQALEEINRVFQEEYASFFLGEDALDFQNDAGLYAVWCAENGAAPPAERTSQMTTRVVYCDGSFISFWQVHEWCLGGMRRYCDAGKVFSLETGEQLPLSHFLELEFEDFQAAVLEFLIVQMEMAQLPLRCKTVQELAGWYGYSSFSDYDYCCMDGELYIILPIDSVTERLTSETDMIVRWPVGAAEPTELLGGTAPTGG